LEFGTTTSLSPAIFSWIEEESTALEKPVEIEIIKTTPTMAAFISSPLSFCGIVRRFLGARRNKQELFIAYNCGIQISIEKRERMKPARRRAASPRAGFAAGGAKRFFLIFFA
jgi:hypothetical protein